MRRKDPPLTICAAVLLGGCMLFGLFGCGAKTGHADDNASKEEPSVAATRPSYPMDNVLDVFSWIGKTTEEIGIPEEYFSGGSYISFEGDLFGSAVYGGTAYLWKDRERGTNTVDRIYLSCGGLSFEDAAAKLAKVYGLPYDTGEEPYAEGNGGAVEWQRFDTGAGTVKISQASKEDFFTIEVMAGVLSGRYEESPDQPDLSGTDEAQGGEPVSVPRTEEPLLKCGLWWAVGGNDDVYYELRDDGTGVMVCQYDGGSADFTYRYQDNQLVLDCFAGNDGTLVRRFEIEPFSSERMKMMSDAGESEEWSYQYGQSLYDFAFYSTEELMKMAQTYYGATSAEGYIPEYVAARIDKDGWIAIQLYDSFEGHNSTSAWYTVDRFTAAGTDTMGDEIDLTVVPAG